MGVFIGPLEHYLGFGRKEVYEQWEGEWDCVFYELQKFVGLLLNSNPNVLSLLLDPGERKTEAERLFQLSQEAYVPSALPPEPDRAGAERLCVEMILAYQQAEAR